MTDYHSVNGKFFEISLIFSWLLIAMVKIYLGNMVYLTDEIYVELLFDVMFWFFGVLVIFLSFVKNGLKSDLIISGLCVFCVLSLMNYKIISFMYSLLVWYSIARLITLKEFESCYLTVFLFLISIIMITLMINGQTYYNDGRYGDVASFGFANSNSFPQLLIILFLVFSRQIKWSILLATFLILLFYSEIKTRTFYIMLTIYPLVLLISRYWLPAALSKIVFALITMNILLVFYHDTQWLAVVDKALSFRLSYSYQLLSEMDTIENYLSGMSASSQKLPMDMSYVVVMLKYGVPATFFLAYLYMQALEKMITQQCYDKVAFILCFLIYALVENVLINYVLNPTLFYVFHALYPVQQNQLSYVIDNKSNI